MKNIINIVKKWSPIFILILLTGCINFRVNYPEINYYNLNQPSVTEISVRNTSNSIQIRDFSMSRKYMGNRIYLTENNSVRPYYYHRWLTDFNELYSDYVRVYFTKTKFFLGGVLPPEALSKPDYIVQGRIIEYETVNNESLKKYYVKLSVSIVLLKADSKGEYVEIFAEDYQTEINRADKEAVWIPLAFEAAAKDLTSKIFDDVTKNVHL